MMDWGFISIILTLSLAIIIWARRRYYTRPELTIELVIDRTSSGQVAYGNNQIADEIIGSGETAIYVFDAEKALRVFQLEWHMNIIIRNNSEFTAYYPKIHFKSNQAKFNCIESLNNQIPIASKGQVILKADYVELEETTGRNRTKIHGFPAALSNMEIYLEYKNAWKRTYVSIFNNSDNKTKFARKLSKSYLWAISSASKILIII
jgi:hypothetical protein